MLRSAPLGVCGPPPHFTVENTRLKEVEVSAHSQGGQVKPRFPDCSSLLFPAFASSPLQILDFLMEGFRLRNLHWQDLVPLMGLVMEGLRGGSQAQHGFGLAPWQKYFLEMNSQPTLEKKLLVGRGGSSSVSLDFLKDFWTLQEAGERKQMKKPDTLKNGLWKPNTPESVVSPPLSTDLAFQF